MQLVLERCTIRPWRLDDAESLAKHANNRKVWLTLRDRFPHPYTLDDAHEFLQRAISEQPTTKFCIEVQGVAARGIGIRLGQDVHRHTAGLGYWLCEEFWGRGVMTETVATLAEFTPRRSGTIRRRRVCWTKSVSFSKAALRTTSSKTESFLIHCSTRRLSSNLTLLCPALNGRQAYLAV
jgi:hypothetical protein